jgi:hypothetical protein
MGTCNFGVIRLPTNVSSTQDLIQQIKDKFLQQHDSYSLLLGEIKHCIYCIGIYQIIAKATEHAGSGNLKYDFFWGWLQQSCLLRQIALDSFKIWQATSEYVSSVVKKVLCDMSQYKQLRKYSQLQPRLDEFGSTVERFKEYRNKRFAHLDNEYVNNNIAFNLQDLFVSLISIEQSLSFIRYYLVNPGWIINSEWGRFSLDNDTSILFFKALKEFLHIIILADRKELPEIQDVEGTTVYLTPINSSSVAAYLSLNGEWCPQLLTSSDLQALTEVGLPDFPIQQGVKRQIAKNENPHLFEKLMSILQHYAFKKYFSFGQHPQIDDCKALLKGMINPDSELFIQ